MPNVPYYYDYMNSVGSNEQPANMHVLNTLTGRFFQRYLLKKAMSVFRWEVPEWWDEDYFLYVLYCWGYCAIFDSGKFGVIPQQCGLQGYNIFYRPTHALISNPLLGPALTKKIGSECVLMHLQPDYSGIMDLVGHYAEKMALASSAVSQNLWATKISTVFFAGSDAEQQSIKKAYDRMSDGDPMVVVSKNLLTKDGDLKYEIFNRDVKQSYVIDQLLSDLRKIEAEYDTRIGVPNANTDKRERLITDEVNANNVETHILADGWMDSIQSSIKDVKDLFGIDIKCEWRYGDGDLGNTLPVGSVSGGSDSAGSAAAADRG